ncbi:MAG: hypothetical protein ACR2GQ_02820 [Gemmatimonadota bacterium]
MRRELGVLAAALLLGAGATAPTATAQQTEPEPESRHDTRFSSFDVGIGPVFPDGADTGLSYGAGFDVANLFVPGTALRFGFRFWTSEDPAAGVDIDDGVLEVLLKLHLGHEPWRGYIGAGFGAHFISARVAAMPETTVARDGFEPGLQLLAGLELTVGDQGFLAVFVEGEGAAVADLRHGLVQAGVRVRFDRLGAR